MMAEVIDANELTEVRGDSMPQVDQVVRHANGGHTVHFRINGEVVMPDGSTVEIIKPVRVKATGWRPAGRVPA